MKSIQIQLTTKCNQKCIMCRKYTWPKKEIALNVLLDKLNKYKDATITFSGGDPLEYSELKELAQYLRDNKRVYQVFTNLTYDLNGTMYDFLANAKFVQVSLDGPDQESYRGIRGSEANFINIIKNVRLLKNVKFNSVVLNDNYMHIEALVHLAFALNSPIRFFPVHTHDRLALTEETISEFSRMIFNLSHKNHEMYYNTNLDLFDTMLNRKQPTACWVKLHHRLIDEDGIEYPCCRAINDNGKDLAGENSVDKLFAVGNPLQLYDFCSGCDRYVRFNANWPEYMDREELFL